MPMRSLPSRCLAVAMLGCLFASDAEGQSLFEFCDDFSKPACQQRDPYEERIDTERHDFTQSAVTVGRGVVQIEGGYSYFKKESSTASESSHTTPEMLLRVGLSEDIEFRLRWHYVWKFIDTEPDESGSEDLRYSLKLQLTRQSDDGFSPTTALEVRGSAPTGGDDFTTRGAEFSLNYIYQWELADELFLTGSTGFGTNGFGDFGLLPEEPAEVNYNALSQSVALGMELSERNTGYAEWFGIYSDGLDDEFVVSVFNVGLDHYLTDDIVLDARFGVGLSGDSDEFFVGVGGGYRF